MPSSGEKTISKRRKRKVKPMSVRWEGKLWPILNRLRGDLVDKDVYEQPMTLTEKADLELLQKYADYYIGRRFPVSRRFLNKIERLIGSTKKGESADKS
jgi:hypothetical protein